MTILVLKTWHLNNNFKVGPIKHNKYTNGLTCFYPIHQNKLIMILWA